MRQEIIEKRSEYAKHFINDDGTRVAEIYTYPVHYKDRDTLAWEESTYLIEPDAQVEGFDHNMKHGPFRSRFGPDQVRFGFAEGKCVTYKFQGANSITPTFGAHKATFAGLYTQTDVVYSILSKELKQEIILADATAPTTFEILLDGNVTPELVDNSIVFKDGDTVVGRIPAPFAIDADGNRGGATLSLNAYTLTIMADADWLSTAVYPVTIDPTTTIQPDATAGKDSYTNATSSYQDTNYGTSTDLKVSSMHKSLLQFDLSSIPSEIVSASANLYSYEFSGTEDTPMSCHKITGSWVETTVTYNNCPTYDATSETSLADTAGIGWASFNITNLAEAWRNGSITNYGVIIVGTVSTSHTHYSSDYVEDATLRPKLVVVYRQSPPTISVPASTTQSSPTGFSNEITPAITFALGASYTQSAYQYQLYDSNNNLAYDSGSISSAGLSFSVPLIAGIKYDEPYGIQVRSMDAADSNWSEWSALHYFKCIMTAPTGLVAGPDPTAARISLSWTAHTAENVAGYNVYRKLPIEADTSYAKVNLDGLIAAAAWNDEFVAYGKGYDYKVVAVARDGYESPTSTAVSNISVTFTSWWLGSVPFDVSPREIQPKRINVVNRRQIMGKKFEAVQRAVLGHEITLSAKFLSEDTLQAFMAEWARTDKALALRDNRGRAWRVQAVSDLDYPQTWAIDRNIYVATMTFVEVG